MVPRLTVWYPNFPPISHSWRRIMIRLAALFVSVLSVAVAAPVTKVFADPTPIVLKKGDRIVFLGDSITAGGNAGKGYIQVIRNHLADKKKDLAIECIG